MSSDSLASVADSTPGSAPNICHTCQLPIATPQFIRVGSYKFHKDHFTCSDCHTSLHEKKFHHKDTKFYCAADYVNKFCHTCRHCKSKIIAGSVIQAFNAYYHPEHFVCKTCSKPFPNGKYYESGDEAYCEEHYYLITAEKCMTCGEGVREAEMVRVQGKVYHSHCLSCSHCNLLLAKKDTIFQKDGKVYCRNDYLDFFCKRCTACSEHILKHCVAGGQDVNTGSGVSAAIETMGDDVGVMSHDGVGMVSCQHDGVMLQPNERECVELTFADGRTLICTPDHEVLTPLGYAPAGTLKAGEATVIASVRLPRCEPVVGSAVHQTEEAFSLRLASGAELHMRDAAARRRTLAFARLLGYVLPSDCAAAVMPHHPIDAVAFQADVDLVSGVAAAATSAALPTSLAEDLAACRAHAAALPSIVLDVACPASVKRAFLSGLYGAAGHAPHLTADGTAFTNAELPAHLPSPSIMLDQVGCNSPIDAVAFETHVGFAYAAEKQQRLAVAAAFSAARRHTAPTISAAAVAASAAVFVAACKADHFFVDPVDPSAAASSSAKHVGTFELALVASAPAGIRPVYDVLNVSHASFQCNGIVVHNCVTVNDEFYHPECLHCSHCKKKLDKYICISGYLRCNEHTDLPVAPINCSICTKVIEGEVVLSVGKKMHPECFKCATCSNPLQKVSAKLKDDKLCCSDCIMKTDATKIAATAAPATNGAHAAGSDTAVYVGAKSASATAASPVAAAAASASSPKPSDHDEFTKYEKPQRSRKPSKAAPQGKIDWKKGELIGKGSFGKVYMAMNCFPVEDHELLTSEGFMSHANFRARVTAGDEVLVACPRLDGSLEMHPIGTSGLVEHTGTHDHVHMASHVDVKSSDRGHHIDLLPTANHNMLVRITDRRDQKESGWDMVTAEEMLAHNQSFAQFRTNAEFGLTRPIERDQPLQFAATLGLRNDEQVNAFLEYYGYWLGAGAINSSRSIISVSPVKKHDVSYLDGLFARLPLDQEGFRRTEKSATQARLSYDITHPSWCQYFASQYGRIAGSAHDVQKWLWSWTTQQLCADQMRLVLRGLQVAAGSESRDAHLGGDITTSSMRFRDELQHLALMAGFSTHCEHRTRDQQQHEWTVHYTAEERSALPKLSVRRDMELTTRTGTVWCVNVPTDDHLIVFRRVADREHGLALSASRPVVVGNSSTGELMAVKQVRLNTAEEQEQAAAIQNEIGLMENLRHPNIVTLLGTQRNGNKLNILMEYVAGRSMDTLIEKFGCFSEKVIRSYTKQLLGALAYCHGNRVVHRDIKGKNILIDTKGNLKLADFGSAKRFTNIMSKDAPSLSYNYTPLWTAPEVLVGDYNSKVDIWSLGCVIIEMASAKPPWSEQNFENPFRALYHIGNSDSIPKIPETLSETGIRFVKNCLRRNPDERPDAASLLKEDWLSGIESLPNNSDESDEDDGARSGSESD